MESKTKLIKNYAFLAAFLIAIGVLFTMTLGLSAKGFDDSTVLSQYFFYAGPLIGFAVGVVFLLLYSIYKTDDEKYGNSLSFNSPGEVPGIKTNFFNSTFKIFLLFAIISSVLFGILPRFQQQSFFGTDIPVLRQQFTVYGNIAFSNMLVPISENLGAAFFWALFLVSFRNFAKKTNMPVPSFQLLAIVFAVILFGLFGFMNHLLRYSTSDTSIVSVVIFWSLGGLVTVLTGSFIPFWVMHISINLFLDLNKYFVSDVSFIAAVSILIFAVFLYIAAFFVGGKKKNES